MKSKIGRDIIEGLPILQKQIWLTRILRVCGIFFRKIYPLNESDVKIVEYLKQLPSIEEYACYFNIDSYYEKR